jgi:hypothetical protein
VFFDKVNEAKIENRLIPIHPILQIVILCPNSKSISRASWTPKKFECSELTWMNVWLQQIKSPIRKSLIGPILLLLLKYQQLLRQSTCCAKWSVYIYPKTKLRFVRRKKNQKLYIADIDQDLLLFSIYNKTKSEIEEYSPAFMCQEAN